MLHLVGQEQPAESASRVLDRDDRAVAAGRLRCSHHAVAAEIHHLALHKELDGQVLEGLLRVMLLPQGLPQAPGYGRTSARTVACRLWPEWLILKKFCTCLHRSKPGGNLAPEEGVQDIDLCNVLVQAHPVNSRSMSMPHREDRAGSSGPKSPSAEAPCD